MSESPPSDSGSGIPGRPVLDVRPASDLAHTLYNVTGTASPLPSDRDQNFLIEDSGGTRYVLKVANADEDRKRLEAQEIAANTAANAGLPVGRLIPASSGDTIASVQIGCDTFLVRLVPYLEGKPMADFRPQSPALLFMLGGMLGRLDKALAGLSHPGAERNLVWDLKQTVDTITERFSDIPDEESRSLVHGVLNAFTTEVVPQIPALPHQIIHADANDYNVLIGFNDSNEAVITGILDFGDMARTIRMSELAVACAYAMLDKTDPVGSACAVVKGYHAENAITENEIGVLYSLIRARLGISVCMSANQKRKEPENPYLTISERPVWALLRQLSDVHPRLATYRFRQACGLEPFPGSGALIAWLQSPERSPADVMDYGTGTPLVFDFSVGSTEWSPELLTNPGLGDREIIQRLEAAGATTGLGRYDEPRLAYTTEAFNEPSGEMRTIHIGLDVFQSAGSPVYAPLDGTVYSFHDNDAPSNYGPTVILEHAPPDGPSFYTLFGHLSRESLCSMRKGLVVPKGERFARLGTAEENGGWIPHLHFQIIGDLLDWKGDFPGVAPASRARNLDQRLSGSNSDLPVYSGRLSVC